MGLFSAQLDGNCLVIKQVQNGKEKKKSNILGPVAQYILEEIW